MDHGTKHAVQLIRSNILRWRTAQTRQMFGYGWLPSHGLIEPIVWRKIELWVSIPMPPVWGQSASYSIRYAHFIEGWTEHTVQVGRWPSWIDQTTSSADGRAGSTMRPARPSTELDQSSSADGRAGSNTRPARTSAELDHSSSADGRVGPSASWTKHATSLAIRLAGTNMLSSALHCNYPPSGLERTWSCFISIGVTVGNLLFKNRKNSFSRTTFGLIVQNGTGYMNTSNCLRYTRILNVLRNRVLESKSVKTESMSESQ